MAFVARIIIATVALNVTINIAAFRIVLRVLLLSYSICTVLSNGMGRVYNSMETLVRERGLHVHAFHSPAFANA